MAENIDAAHSSSKKLTKADIKNEFEQIKKSMDANGHLDHAVRAVEDYIEEKSQQALMLAKKPIQEKLKKDPAYQYKMTADEKKIFNTSQNFFKIFKHQSQHLGCGKGRILYFDLAHNCFIQSAVKIWISR